MWNRRTQTKNRRPFARSTAASAFRSADLQDALGRLTNNNTQKEYYITDTVAILRGDGKKVETLVVEDTTEIMGVNDRVQLLEAQEIAKERIFRRLMLSGVTIYEKASTFIAPDAVIGPDTEILPSTIIKGGCVIGEDCVIGPGSELSNMTIGDRTTVKHTVAMDSTIGSDTTVGPFAYVRPKCVVGDHVKVGDFVELKNSNIGEGTKISHLTYVGDSDFGKNINIGCGTVTVNYDGHKKFRTVVEDNCFIGCNTNLVAPVTVHAGSFIAAGSTITDEVPDGSLAIARARQVNKEGWNTKREENYQ